jgi:hypothetical protein
VAQIRADSPALYFFLNKDRLLCLVIDYDRAVHLCSNTARDTPGIHHTLMFHVPYISSILKH